MDTALKQRLIGAAVLVALAVFFLPLLVKGPAPDSGVSSVSTDIPDSPADTMETRDLPLAAPGDVPKGGAVGLDATPVDRPAAQPAATTPAEAPGAAGAGTQGADAAIANPPVTANATSGALPPAAAGGDYAVHFGAYATAKAADTVVALAKAAQLPAYSEPATVGGKAAWRVRIGPYATRADAESARLKALDVRSDVPVRVVVLDAESAAPTTSDAPSPAAPVEAPKPAVVAKPAEAPKPDTKPIAAKPAEPAPAAPKPAVPKPVVPKPADSAVAAVPKPAAPKPAEPKPAATLPAPPKPAATAASAPSVAAPAAKPAAPAAKPADSGTLVAVAPKPKPTPAPAAAAAKVGFAVQLGAFGDAAEANALRDRLRASGFAAFTETVSTDKGPLTRVRVGPVVDRAAADQLKAQVQAKTGVNGIVRPHP